MQKFRNSSIVLVLILLAGIVNAAQVAYWSCDQNETDQLVLDRIGTANGVLEDKTYGPPPNRMKFVPSGAGLDGDYGYALWTDNLNDRANLSEVDAFDFGKSNFTITGWFNSSNYARHGCILRHGWWDIGGFDVVILKNNGSISFEVFGPTANKSVISDNVLNDGKWHWFAGVVNSETLYLYIDGVLQTASGVTYDPGTTATVSGQSTFINMDMAGSVDDIGLYNTSLSATLNQDNALVAGELYFVWHGLSAQGPTICDEVWQAGYGNEADLNQDCTVDFKDFAEFSLQWLTCNDPTDEGCQHSWQ
ncbi:MAG: hypothetical protein A2Y10_01960 [Planctomycetes bacterium GWF2_41_51]|nr:MAG: hypothetical protein A2Y10_01960 [Planctomycetes bacterium GWF2_41_51]HBG26296.1 hypothetical protein [Phycisphaerales bacterium]